MLKRISILSFICLFLLSTTGMPLSLHLCAMQDSAFLDSCDMCSDVPVSPLPCCNETAQDTRIHFSKIVDSCCQDQVVDKKVDDEFCLKTELRKIVFTPLTFLNISGAELQIPELKYFTKELPPILNGSGKRYLDISIFLI